MGGSTRVIWTADVSSALAERARRLCFEAADGIVAGITATTVNGELGTLGQFFGLCGKLHSFQLALGGGDDAVSKIMLFVAGATTDLGGFFVHQGNDGVIGEPLTFHAVVVDDIA